MPYLNWKDAELNQEVSVHPTRGTQLTLVMGRERLTEFIPILEEALIGGGSELRLDLPRKWVIFWKSREAESRLLLAHPQPEEWVATVALDLNHGTHTLAGLKALQPGMRLALSEVSPVGDVSNLELVVFYAESGAKSLAGSQAGLAN